MIDVIVPVYDTPLDLLKRCFESIVRQTHSDWEVIIIDDGSNSTVRKWLDEWCAKHDGFCVTHTKNKGVSRARNLGIELSKGEYITFCDADDELDCHFMECMEEKIRKDNSDLVICGSVETDGTTKIKYQSRQDALFRTFKEVALINSSMLVATPAKKFDFLGNIMLGRSIAKLYKRTIVKEINFIEGLSMHEDNIFSYDAFCKCRSVSIVKKILYKINTNFDSLTHSMDTTRYRKQELEFASVLERRRVTGTSPYIENAINCRLLWTFINYSSTLVEMSSVDRKSELRSLLSMEIFKKVTRCSLKEFDKNKLSIGKKLFLVLVRIKPEPIRICFISSVIKLYGMRMAK